MSEPARPRLALVYSPRSFPTLLLTSTASGLCDPLWIIDSSDRETSLMTRLLRRFGQVLDVRRLSPGEAANAIRPLAPDGILTLFDGHLVWTAEVAERLGLPFFSPATATCLTDKQAQRAAMANCGLPVPSCRVVPPPGDTSAWQEFTDCTTFPAVMKPRIGEGSRNTLLVRDMEAVRAAVDDAMGSDRVWVVEEYLADREEDCSGPFAGYVSVESVVNRGRIGHVAVTGRFPPADPFRETGFFIPSALTDADRTAVLEAATGAVHALAIESGCLHTEIKLTPKGPRVIEVNGRIGGGIPEMLQAASGFDIMATAFRLALGEELEVVSPPASTQVAWLLYVQAPKDMRLVTAVDGLETLQAMDGVKEISLNRGPGSRVDWHDGNHGYVFSVFGTAPDHAALQRIAECAHKKVTIRGE